MLPVEENILIPLLKNAKSMKELVDDAGSRLRQELTRFPDKIHGKRRSVSYCGTINGDAVYRVSYTGHYSA